MAKKRRKNKKEQAMHQTRQPKAKLSKGFSFTLKATDFREAVLFAERVDTLRNVGNVDKPVVRYNKRDKANDPRRQRKAKAWLNGD